MPENKPDSTPATPSRTEVWKMFDRIAHRYDLLNRLLSLGRDVAWRKRVSKYLPERPDLSVLDLATGTGDLLISVHDHSGRVTSGVGIDMAGKMLEIARAKIAERNLQDTLSMIHGDATRLPFNDSSFDAVTIAFGIRNFADVPTGLKQMGRVLRNEGKALILEFSLPGNWLVRKMYLVYFRYILPLIGSLISGDSYAYRYLNRTVETFPHGEEFCALMNQAGFCDVQAHRLTFGIATIYEGTRREPVKHRPGNTTMPAKSTRASGFEQATEIVRNEINRLLAPASESEMNTPGRIERIEVDIPRLSPFEWLSAQTSRTKTYWRNRDDGLEMAGIGSADLIDSARNGSLSEGLDLIKSALETGENDIRYFGGCRFDASTAVADEWQAFGIYRFILPRFEVIAQSGRTHFACNLLPDQDREKKTAILEQLYSLIMDESRLELEIPNVLERTDIPDVNSWQANVNSVLASISDGRYDKIVLARKTSLRSDTPLSPASIMSKLRDNSTGCYLFMIQINPETAFLGSTPERLYCRDDDTLHSEAIAGTRPRGATDGEDEALAAELKSSDKDIREHRLVVRSIKEGLLSFAETDISLVGQSEMLVKLAGVQHLKTSLAASLKPDVAEHVLLEALHPTAAVGGYPKAAAMSEIGKMEKFDRGWYAGPVGWLSRGRSEFAVAIRSALVYKESLNVYAGAGIVEGSIAELEWEEIENKMSGFMRILT